MALALRLTVLSHVVAHANALWFQTGSNAGDWALATPTAGSATLSPGEPAPRITSAPRRRSLDWQFQRRDDNTSTICGYPVNSLDELPVTCGRGEYCHRNQFRSIVVCCTALNPRDCNVPTACLESSLSEQWSGDPSTTYCSDSARPHCVTQSYSANFFDSLYGASFVGCAAKAASGDIVATYMSESDTTSTNLSSTPTTVGGATTASLSSSSSGGPSTTTSPISSKDSSSKNIGAIVGGVVGGVAGLALIIAAIFFLLKRRRKKQEPEPEPPPFGPKMPPGDFEIYRHDPIPGSQYPSSFFGEAPPGMVQTQAPPPVMVYPPNLYGYQDPVYTVAHSRNSEVPAYYPHRAPPSKPQDDAVSPIEESPVSPVSPADNYNTMVSALSNNSPPLQPLQPAIHRPQSEYAPYSPPPPAQYQSYHPYPGT